MVILKCMGMYMHDMAFTNKQVRIKVEVFLVYAIKLYEVGLIHIFILKVPRLETLSVVRVLWTMCINLSGGVSPTARTLVPRGGLLCLTPKRTAR